MACDTCVNNCCTRPCVDELLCAISCGDCCHIPVLMLPNLDLEAGTILAQQTSTQRFGAFNPLANDGLQVPVGILKYHIQTNDAGDITGRYFGIFGLGLDCGPKYTNMYVSGFFRTQELRGDVASAIAAGLLRLIDGSVDAGLVKLI